MTDNWDGRSLSKTAAVIWGKSKRDSDASLSLWRHLSDAGQVAGLLWDHWVPERAREVIASCLPEGHSDARRLLVWLAASHDIGKATPSFTLQAPKLAERGQHFGLTWLKRERYPPCAHHTVTGQLILEHWLADRHGWRLKQYRQFACVVGGHHGNPPTGGMLEEITDSTSHRPALGWRPGETTPSPWREAQWELLDWTATAADVNERFDAWRDVKLSQQAQVLLTAIVIVADWIASNEDYFPYESTEIDNQHDRLAAGWRAVSLPPRWRAHDLPSDVADFYRTRFTDRPPRPLQTAAVTIARELTEPSIMIIEAPMGEGKTEAALLAAEVIAERDGGGVVFALPTRATSNGILPRIVDWLRKIAKVDSAPLDLGLGHGKSRFNPDFQILRRAGYTCVDADWAAPKPEPGRRKRRLPLVAAHRWLTGRKRALLSQFAVVTIDQILMAALTAKHVVLRHLGLAGKTVIIDEAHAYDVHMSQYLHQVIKWLAGYGCSVIVLSATLPAAKRDELIAAFHDGADTGTIEPDTYPVITAVSRSGRRRIMGVEADATRGTTVAVEMLDETRDATPCAAMIGQLTAALRDGGCVLVLRNTVKRAEQTATALAEHFADSATVRLVHSRFIDADRERNDTWLRSTFGPERPGVTSPTIVVATQVAEQSLDVDFDLLITDLAPIDLLLQRMGRVHRHQRGVGQSERPEPLRTARCLITGADWSAQPPTPVRPSTYIYHPYLLLRAAAVLADHAEAGRCDVNLPGDIAPLVQAAYGGDRVGPAAWHAELAERFAHFEASQAHREAEARRFRLKDPESPGRSLVNWLAAGVGDVDEQPEGRAQVRDGQDSIEVLLLLERDDRWYLPKWLEKHGGVEISREAEPPTAIATAALGCAISLPFWLSPDEVIAELEHNEPPGWQNSPWLAGELVLILHAETLSTTVAGHRIGYHPETGLTVTRPQP